MKGIGINGKYIKDINDYFKIGQEIYTEIVSIDEEKKQLKARILVTGMPSGRYFIESVLHQKICIAVGKYQSDRLSIEIKKIREQMAEIGENTEELQLLVMDCIYLI